MANRPLQTEWLCNNVNFKAQKEAKRKIGEERQQWEAFKKLELHPVEKDGRYGSVDETGNIAIPCKWVYAHDFHEGLAQVKDDNEKWGFINKTGMTVIPCKWKRADSFHDNKAIIRNDYYTTIYIDKTGKVISGNGSGDHFLR